MTMIKATPTFSPAAKAHYNKAYYGNENGAVKEKVTPGTPAKEKATPTFSPAAKAHYNKAYYGNENGPIKEKATPTFSPAAKAHYNKAYYGNENGLKNIKAIDNGSLNNQNYYQQASNNVVGCYADNEVQTANGSYQQASNYSSVNATKVTPGTPVKEKATPNFSPAVKAYYQQAMNYNFMNFFSNMELYKSCGN